MLVAVAVTMGVVTIVQFTVLVVKTVGGRMSELLETTTAMTVAVTFVIGVMGKIILTISGVQLMMVVVSAVKDTKSVPVAMTMVTVVMATAAYTIAVIVVIDLRAVPGAVAAKRILMTRIKVVNRGVFRRG
jgi:hypothetical protein